MKQKVVIRLYLSGCDQKCRSKAFKKAVSLPGVESAAMTGDEKNQLEVVGEIDAVELTRVLRKSMGQAELVSVGPDKKKEEKKPEVVAIETLPQPALYCYAYPPQCPVYQVTDSDGFCSIM
ncbi:heavy metal-associated isoprenylated plant protein 12-like [Lycium ferocissimum]|uniref:heavy metal-associated isoprenylated plant protein 12-like n=1 Tax=Lycium ferocissimum TaxID=112874 RepID=UPI0028152637|nr:heavy metal-associated isoprenylated plant protein 12-like [Lycium ferocissimum]